MDYFEMMAWMGSLPLWWIVPLYLVVAFLFAWVFGSVAKEMDR